jgi:hypothetical protein
MARRSTGNIIGVILGYLLTKAAFKLVGAGFRGLFHLGQAVANSPRAMGKRGERRVLAALRALPSEYIVLPDLLLPHGNGTAQIDAVVAGPTGLYVIEVKNWYGWIEGGPEAPTWMLYTNSGRYTHQNPLHQNRGHIAAIRKNLPSLPEWACHGVVVVPEDGLDVPVTLYDAARNGLLVQPATLSELITQFYPAVFDTQTVQYLADALRELNIEGRAARRAHARRVQREHGGW